MNNQLFEQYLQENHADTVALMYLGQHSHLLPAGIDELVVAEQFAYLVADQQARIAMGLPPSPLPLLWLALALAAGLTVDIPTGRIVGGPTVPLWT